MGIIFGIMFSLMLGIIVIKMVLTRIKKANCIKDKHHLTETTQTEMLATGDKSYTIGWFCDKCLVRYVRVHERMSTPFFRCNVCKFDYCEICKNNYFNPSSPGLSDQSTITNQYAAVVPLEVDEEAGL